VLLLNPVSPELPGTLDTDVQLQPATLAHSARFVFVRGWRPELTQIPVGAHGAHLALAQAAGG
jgi:hypothetical protein